jgi:hypothetical protein
MLSGLRPSVNPCPSSSIAEAKGFEHDNEHDLGKSAKAKGWTFRAIYLAREQAGKACLRK